MGTQKRLFSLLAVITLTIPIFANTAFGAFSDVPESHEYYTAVSYLEGKGVIEGYEDGTYRPDNTVNRAEAVKIVVAPLYETFEDPTENPFPDVTTDLWYAKYVKKAKDLEVVSGDGQTGNFIGDRTVNLVEFLKILLLSYNVNLSAYENPTEVVYYDVQDLNEWFIPYLYYAGATNLINADGLNNIYPGKELTRGEVAQIAYRLMLNMEGGEVQLYLSMTEAEIIKILQALGNNDTAKAESAAANALNYANYALELSPEEPVVQAAQKITVAFDHLVKGKVAGINGQYSEAETHASEAWAVAEEAKNIDSSVNALSDSVKEIANDMGDDARANM
ncbi:S-layer homology domain-containing protein [Patescibacteria group bacterium]